MPDLSPADRDLITRTVYGEANGEPPAGQAAVVHTILNRLASGRHGESVPDVVFQRRAFEPWSTRSRELSSLDPASPAYQRISQIVDAVAAGKIEDPTGGATHFFAPRTQAALGRRPPNWGTGEPTATIGGHTFFAPEGRVSEGVDAINRAIGARGQGEGNPSQALSYEAGAGLRQWTPKEPEKPAASSAAPAGPAYEPGSALRQWTTTATPAAGAPAGAPAAAVYQEGEPVDQISRLRAGLQPLPPTPAADLPGTRSPISEYVTGLPGNFIASTKENALASSQLAQSGMKDIGSGQYFPTMPSPDPRTWTGGGLLKTGVGALGVPFSPLTAATSELVAKPVTNLTGSPQAGETAGAIAGFGVPGALAAGKAASLTPKARGANALIEAIGEENLPGAISRMEANPRLTPMDVSETVRTLAQGIAADPAAPKAQSILRTAARDRRAGLTDELRAGTESNLGTAPSALTVLDSIKQRARDTGKQIIEPALATSKPVDVGRVVADIDAELKPGVQAVTSPGLNTTPSSLQQELLQFRKKLTDENGNVIVDPIKLHEIQSGLRARAYQLSQSSSGADRLLGSDLYGFRNKLVDAIDAATGGKYKPGLEKYADDMRVHEAFDRGRNITRNRAGDVGITEDSPEAWARWAKKATADELDGARVGVISSIMDKIRLIRRESNFGKPIPDSEFTHEKLVPLFGKDKADQFMRYLRDERDIAETNSKLVHGSKTAETLAGRNALAVREPGARRAGGLDALTAMGAEALSYSQGGIPGAATVGLLALRGAQKGVNYLGRQGEMARNSAFARYASATGPERETILDIMRARRDAGAVRGGNKLQNALAAPFLAALPR